MAIMETKIVQVKNDPGIINYTNEEWSRWGWSVLSVQVTHSQNTKTYTDGLSDEVNNRYTVETTTINYATITYQRDKEMPNYGKIARLEQEEASVESRVDEFLKDRYAQLKSMEPPEALEFHYGILHILLTIFLLYCWIIPGVLYIRSKVREYKAAKACDKGKIAQMQAEYDRYKNQLAEERARLIAEEHDRIERERMQLMPA